MKYTVQIIPKDSKRFPPIPTTLHNVEEYHCGEKMFYVQEESGEAYYCPVDEIFLIHVIPGEGGEQEC
ncbi:MAG: hypothetical protein IJP92_02715 [Lachnospiraceae bacterium]|nr:hypothetical protein [Lachnospiraceae bacterium]